MKSWKVVYWNDAEGRSKVEDDLWADTHHQARDIFSEAFPEVTRIIGVYEVRQHPGARGRTGGCANC